MKIFIVVMVTPQITPKYIYKSVVKIHPDFGVYEYLIFNLFLLKQVIAIVGTYISSEHHLLPWIYESCPLYGRLC